MRETQVTNIKQPIHIQLSIEFMILLLKIS